MWTCWGDFWGDADVIWRNDFFECDETYWNVFIFAMWTYWENSCYSGDIWGMYLFLRWCGLFGIILGWCGLIELIVLVIWTYCGDFGVRTCWGILRRFWCDVALLREFLGWCRLIEVLLVVMLTYQNDVWGGLIEVIFGLMWTCFVGFCFVETPLKESHAEMITWNTHS